MELSKLINIFNDENFLKNYYNVLESFIKKSDIKIGEQTTLLERPSCYCYGFDKSILAKVNNMYFDDIAYTKLFIPDSVIIDEHINYQIDFKVSGGEIPLNTSSQDFALLHLGLELSQDCFETLHEVWRTLKPYAYVYIILINPKTLKNYFLCEDKWLDKYFNTRFYDSKYIVQLLKSMNFIDIKDSFIKREYDKTFLTQIELYLLLFMSNQALFRILVAQKSISNMGLVSDKKKSIKVRYFDSPIALNKND